NVLYTCNVMLVRSSFKLFELFAQRGNFHLQLGAQFDDRIRQIPVVELVDAYAVLFHNPSRVANNRAIRRHLFQHNGVGANSRIRPYSKRTKHLGSRPDDDIAADRRMALSFFLARAAKRNSLINDDIIANLARFADDYPHAVVDEKPLADYSA